MSNQARAQKVVNEIETFVATITQRAGEKHAARVIQERATLDGREIGQKPERFVEETLIDALASALGYDYRYQPKGFEGLNGRIPDFTATNLDVPDFGEIKPPGGIVSARKENVEYLDLAEQRPFIGIATDGFVWILHTAEEGDEYPSYTHHVTLHELVRKVRMLQTSSAEEQRHRHLRELALKFVSEFNIDAVESTVS